MSKRKQMDILSFMKKKTLIVHDSTETAPQTLSHLEPVAIPGSSTAQVTSTVDRNQSYSGTQTRPLL